MINNYDVNGLMVWSQEEIWLRNQFKEFFINRIKGILGRENSAWKFYEIESPILTPRVLVNPNYTNEDIFIQEKLDEEQELVLRPETTPGSYAYASHLLNNNSEKPPFVVYQQGKSFRREQDQVTKNMRLKEFYQLEFQCFYTEDTFNDYHSNVLEPIRKMFSDMISLPARIVDSDRLPSYSIKTSDVEIDNGDKWMEVCSVSLRKDFATEAKFQKGSNVISKKLLVLEIAIGMDRCVYNFNMKNK